MPKYDYFCPSNGQTIEVNHSMKERLESWGELAEKAGILPGETPKDAPVKKLITGGSFIRAGALKNPERPPCQSGAPCPGQCGFG